MRECGRDWPKRQAVWNGEGGGQEQWAIGLVIYLVKGGVGIDDPGDVVGLAEMIERSARRDSKGKRVILDGTEAVALITHGMYLMRAFRMEDGV